MNEPFIYLAPLRGLTDAGFRNIFLKHFKGYDAAVAPFINPQSKALYDDKMLLDVLPENNTCAHLVPQLLHTDPDEFLVLARRLADLGYRHINWNLGCPAPMVARKKRGSGLLPHPDKILAALDRIVTDLPGTLSIKTRLGYHDDSELINLLPDLGKYPLQEIIIHTRLGRQLYRGNTDPDGFAKCLETTSHQLVYNGDINNVGTYHELNDRFPTVNRWMLGRGAIGNPFLAEEIKLLTRENGENRKTRLVDFHEELFGHYCRQLSGPGHILGKLKHFWTYFITVFPDNQKALKKIFKCHDTTKYRQIVDALFQENMGEHQ